MQRLFLSLSAVAFDLDDTLFDREVAVRTLVREWLGDVSIAEIQEILRRDGRGHAAREPFFAWLAATWPELGENPWQRFREELPHHVMADPAARPLLERITAADLPVALLTNGGTVTQLAKLQATGLTGFFPPERILISQSIGVEKPDPKSFTALTNALDLPPERILFIGDHAETDIAGAKNAGLRTCWLRRRDPGAICDEADLVVDSLAEIISLLLHPA
ncbi:MAG: HAD family hydrolase [Verrucomicrobiota bacterium]